MFVVSRLQKCIPDKLQVWRIAEKCALRQTSLIRLQSSGQFNVSEEINSFNRKKTLSNVFLNAAGRCLLNNLNYSRIRADRSSICLACLVTQACVK